MKYSEQWLSEWVELPEINLRDQLTMAGFEVETVLPAAPAFSGVVIGEIRAYCPHPARERLFICTVAISPVNHEDSPLTIVCGANNLSIGMKVAVATEGALLPDGRVMTSRRFASINSQGMLCSASELGLTGFEKKTTIAGGILALPRDAAIGTNVWDYLALSDRVWEVTVTPNRGDCLSMRGLSREISAIMSLPYTDHYTQSISSCDATSTPVSHGGDKSVYEQQLPQIEETKPRVAATLPVTLSTDACPRYIGRIIRQKQRISETPLWLIERLRRSGLSIISPIVDITNYVMLEGGQPLHAFDLSNIRHGIQVRFARANEQLVLLNGHSQPLTEEILIIADDEKPLAIAGVMGGLAAGIRETTTDIWLESAYFLPEIIARQRQACGLISEAAYRFERGVDPTIQRLAIERATQLILSLSSESIVGPIIEVTASAQLPFPKHIQLSLAQVTTYLGISIQPIVISNIFDRLYFKYDYDLSTETWQVIVPLHRFDVITSQDLIEEIARLYGYEAIPLSEIPATSQTHHCQGLVPSLEDQWRVALRYQGYHEVINYSFVDQAVQAILAPDDPPLNLLNPMTAEMSVMRTTLWTGLINALRYNRHHQQSLIRLFEVGTCFVPESIPTPIAYTQSLSRDGATSAPASRGVYIEDRAQQMSQADNKPDLERRRVYREEKRLAGLITGAVAQEHWGVVSRQVDFFDIKGQVENILALLHGAAPMVFTVDHLSLALHPGQAANITYQGQKIGCLGALHPRVLQALALSSLDKNLFVFELYLNHLPALQLPQLVQYDARQVAKFPAIRRDVALLVDQTISAQIIQDTIKSVATDYLQSLFVFDIYQGEKVPSGSKSIALGLIFQHPQRTLADKEIVELMERVLTTLKSVLGATLRS